MNTLPDDALRKIFSYLPLKEGKSVTLVNRRFNNLFHQVPELWQQYKVKLPKEESDCDAAVAAVSSQLQRVAPFVREFSFMQPIEYEVQTWAVDSLLQLLPASLQRLHVGKPTPDEDEAALLRFTQLQHLELFQDFLPSTADAICQLQRLTSLRIGWSYVDDYEEADAYQLAQLGQLLELQVEVYTGGRLLLPPLADFSQLLVGFYTGPTIVVSGIPLDVCGLRYGGHAPDEPHTTLAAFFDVADPANDGAEWGELLAAVVPAEQQLGRLELIGCGLSSLAACRQQLSGVQHLYLRDCFVDGSEVTALLESCPQLVRLQMHMDEQVSEQTVLQWDGLQLPAQLTALNVGSTESRLPPDWMPTLTALQELAVEYSPAFDLDSDMVAQLAGMTSLRRLSLPCPGDGVEERYREGVQELQQLRPDMVIEFGYSGTVW